MGSLYKVPHYVPTTNDYRQCIFDSLSDVEVQHVTSNFKRLYSDISGVPEQQCTIYLDEGWRLIVTRYQKNTSKISTLKFFTKIEKNIAAG